MSTDVSAEKDTAVPKVELRLNEAYQRTKRNALLSCATGALIGIAGGATTKIPGLSDTGMPMTGALAVVWVASIFFMIEFATEWRMVIVRNSRVAARLPKDDLDQIFGERVAIERQTIAEFEAAARGLDNVMTRRSHTHGFSAETFDVQSFLNEIENIQRAVDRFKSPGEIIPEGSLEQKRMNSFHAMLLESYERIKKLTDPIIPNLQDAQKRAASALTELNTVIEKLTCAVEARSELDQNLSRDFRTLHDGIHRMQRRSIFRDFLVCAAMLILVTELTAYRVSQWVFSSACVPADWCGALR